MPGQSSRSLFVAPSLQIFGVLAAVEFDGKFQFVAVVVEYVRRHGMLAPELQSAESTVPQQQP